MGGHAVRGVSTRVLEVTMGMLLSYVAIMLHAGISYAAAILLL